MCPSGEGDAVVGAVDTGTGNAGVGSVGCAEGQAVVSVRSVGILKIPSHEDAVVVRVAVALIQPMMVNFGSVPSIPGMLATSK